MSTLSSQRGFSVIEILVVVTIVGIAIFSLYELVVISRTSTSNQMRRLQALSYAQEGMEAMRSIRDRSWDSHIAPLTETTAYYLTFTNSTWTLTTTNPGPLDGLFTRIIKVAPVTRDSNGNIVTGGTTDPDTRRVTVTVTWAERGSDRSVELQTYLTNFQQ